MDDRSMHEALPLRTVSRLTGLSPDIIRAWEKRYSVVAPMRGARGARLYSAADVAHLSLLGRVVGAGRAIGDVARLDRRTLEALARTSTAAMVPDRNPAPLAGEPGEVVTQARAALARFDADALDCCLSDALAAHGVSDFVGRIVEPLVVDITRGAAARHGAVADARLLASVLRNLLAGLLRSRGEVRKPLVLLSAPAGERHELSLLLAALLVAEAGVALCYLGTDLPAPDLAEAARRAGAAVVGLALADDDNQRAAAAELRCIERELPSSVELWLGGRAAGGVAAHLGDSRALVLDPITRIESELARVRALSAARA
jgi:DNA-binding transcriptional MerR regulator